MKAIGVFPAMGILMHFTADAVVLEQTVTHASSFDTQYNQIRSYTDPNTQQNVVEIIQMNSQSALPWMDDPTFFDDLLLEPIE